MPGSLRVRLVTGADLPLGDDETRFLAAALRRRGWHVDVDVWSDPGVDWSDAPLTVIRSTWDYPHHLDRFLAWTASTARCTALHNPPELVRRNVDKRYLMDLETAGVAVVPSRWTAGLDDRALDEVARTEGWDDVVVKPVVGVDGLGVVRLRRGGELPDLPEQPEGWLLQPFLSTIATEGERSVILFDGRPSHAVSKHPPPDSSEFRVQERWGGRTVPAPRDPGSEQVARAALQAFVGEDSARPLYARVDLLRLHGAWCVAEVEVVEPSFYLEGEDDRVGPFDDALRGRLP